MAFVMPLGWCTKKILTKFLQDRTSYFSTESNKHGLFKAWNKYTFCPSLTENRNLFYFTGNQ